MAPRFNEPLFVISVAARLVEMHPQTLRKYEREGLVAPSRTTGNLRLYSDRDIERLRQVKYLVDERGLNLAGVQIALDMTQSLLDLRKRLSRSQKEIEQNAAATAELAASIQHLDRSLAMLGYVPLREPS
jgi:MerR family transcriptional regulator, heat shock protein HspR